MSEDRLVFFDLETDSVREDCQIIQIAAIATDGKYGELKSIELKIKFDERRSDPEALRINHYNPDVWGREAVDPAEAVMRFDLFLGLFKCVECVSKRTGKAYKVARLAGYNAVTFDFPRLKRLYGDRFMPAHPQVLDVMQLVMWRIRLDPEAKRPKDVKLQTIAGWIHLPESKDSHDALADVRTTIEVARWFNAAKYFG